MQDDLEAILKPGVVKRYRGKSAAEFFNAPLNTLNFLSTVQVKKLQGQNVRTVGDLAKMRDTSAVTAIHVDAALLEKLICLLLYPEHDAGPNCAWERLFQSAPLDYYINFLQTP